jgi:hypothetical protein
MICVQPVRLYDAKFALQITSRPDLERAAPYFELYISHPKPQPPVEPVIDTTPPTPGIVYGQSGILDGVYIKETLPDPEVYAFHHADGRISEIIKPYVKYKSPEGLQREIDSVTALFNEECRIYRETIVQPIVDSLLEPFWLSAHEVTNAEYRRFVKWVQDSVAFELLYQTISDDDLAFRMLQTSQEPPAWTEDGTPVEIDESDREQNRQYFPFDYSALDKKKVCFYELYPEELQDLYLPVSERFYKRREIDVRKLRYASRKISPTPVYPDTLSWLRDTDYAMWINYLNVYFWHPAYDNYPVVGVNEQQMRAYCDWLEKMKNKELSKQKAAYRVGIGLPKLFHYEMAAKVCVEPARRETIDAFPEAPFVLQRSEEDALAFVVRALPGPVTGHECTAEGLRKINEWLKVNQTQPFPYLLGGVSEYCADCDTDNDSMTVLGANRRISLIDKQENQVNTAFYRQKIPADSGSATTGFRLVVYIRKP